MKPTMIVAAAALGVAVLAPTETSAQVVPSVSASAEAPLTLEALEQMALAHNPTLRQATLGVEAAHGRARQAGTWPNPTVGYTADEVSRGPVIRGGEHGVFAEQAIPLFGKRQRAASVFDREAEEAQAQAALQQQRVVSAVRTSFYELLTATRRVETRDRLAQLASEAVGVSRQLYNVGAADRSDVLESEVGATRAQLEATAARNRRFALWRHLAATVGDPAMSLRPLAGSIESAIPELDRQSALEALLDHSPEVVAARADVERSRAVVARARRETAPDLFLRGGLSYNRELLETSGGRPRPVGWEGAFEAGLSIPLFNRNQGGIIAARADQARAEVELQRLSLSIESRLASAFDDYLTTLRASEAYRTDVLPRAEDAYRLYLARYREMAAAYPQVLIAQRTLFEMTDQYLASLEGAWRAALRIQGYLLDADGLGILPAGDAEGRETSRRSR